MGPDFALHVLRSRQAQLAIEAAEHRKANLHGCAAFGANECYAEQADVERALARIQAGGLTDEQIRGIVADVVSP